MNQKKSLPSIRPTIKYVVTPKQTMNRLPTLLEPTEILVLLPLKARVRLVSIDYQGRMAKVEENPCECGLCTVGYTDKHHCPHAVATVSIDKLSFPEYGFLHYWDNGPVKERFIQKAGTRLTRWL